MKQLTCAEKENLEAALLLLRESPEPIARRTLQVINTGEVNLYAFQQLTRSDWKKMVRELEGEQNNFLSGQFPVTAEDVLKLNNFLDGWQFGRNIYLDLTNYVTEIASTLVHEVTHYSNNHYPHYSGVFISESEAYLGEAFFRGKRLSRYLLFAVGTAINQDYKLNEEPKRLSLAPDSTPELPKLEFKSS